MLQPNHRGIYEYLWSEHKYIALSISIRSFQTTAGKLGKIPQCLTLLRRLLSHAKSDKPEITGAVLNAYMHLKPHLSRAQREEIIETLLAKEAVGRQMIYDGAIKYDEASLFGCRLFFPLQKAIYKFWDAQDHPGLWQLFGPFQLHLTPPMVFKRLITANLASADELRNKLKQLQQGVSIEAYREWPETLREGLENSNMVAMPGVKAVLHPRAGSMIDANDNFEFEFNLYHLAAFALEKIWDDSDQEQIGQMPEFEEFARYFNAERLREYNWRENFSCEEAFEFLTNAYNEQKQREQGKTVENSAAGIGMEAADEKVYPEKSEHGDDEAED
jgi:hypothetical protein